MRSFEEFVKIYSVDDVACSINSFWPKTLWCLVFIKHSASLLKSSVFSFNSPILLGSVCSRELMTNAMFIEEFSNMSIFELSSIVTSDMLNSHIIFIMGLLGEAFEDILGVGFVFKKECPTVSREIVKNNQTIMTAIETCITLRTE